jgi:hypothetical protein
LPILIDRGAPQNSDEHWSFGAPFIRRECRNVSKTAGQQSASVGEEWESREPELHGALSLMRNSKPAPAPAPTKHTPTPPVTDVTAVTKRIIAKLDTQRAEIAKLRRCVRAWAARVPAVPSLRAVPPYFVREVPRVWGGAGGSRLGSRPGTRCVEPRAGSS